MKRFFWVAALLVSGWGLAGCNSPTTHPMHAKAAYSTTQPVVIDVRTPEEFARNHLPGTINIPVDTLQSRIEEVVPDKNTPVAVHCQSGRRAAIAADLLRAKGYKVNDLGSYANAEKFLMSRP